MKKILVVLLVFITLNRLVYAEQTYFLTKGQGVPVLLYHHILTKEENKKFKGNKGVITPEQFAHQMKILHDNGYKTVTLQELEPFIYKKGIVPEKSVVITFDDGYLSNLKYAYPLLKKYQYHAVIFPIARSIKNQPESFNPDKLNYMSWPEMSRSLDVFQYEGHTYDFHRMIGRKSFLLAKPQEDVAIDLGLSKTLLLAQYFAYPYGQYDQNTIRLLQEEGYKMAFTTRPGKVYPGTPPFEIPRYGVLSTTTTQQFKNIVGIH